MGVGEPETFAGKLVEVGSGDLGLRVVACHVAVSEVIGEDEKDVGARRRFQMDQSRDEQEKEGSHGGKGRAH